VVTCTAQDTWGNTSNCAFNVNAQNAGDTLGGAGRPGAWNEGTWYLDSANGPAANPYNGTVFSFGPTDVQDQIAGDWNGDGVDTTGYVAVSADTFTASARVWLRNANTTGGADLQFDVSLPPLPDSRGRYIPLAGDWNGDGISTVGFYEKYSGKFYLTNSNPATSAEPGFLFTPANFYPGMNVTPLPGDWNGDGADSIGVWEPYSKTLLLRNSNSAGPADITIVYDYP
jgi:hypothetical protein